MARRTGSLVPQEVEAIINQMNVSSPIDAIRLLSRKTLDGFFDQFGDAEAPMNIEALASFRSIRKVDELPVFSEDAELIPNGDKGMLMRLNPERPLTRQRFSMGHEIGHTLFPGYNNQVQCRIPRQRDWHDPNNLVEFLCDIASSEFLFPLEWFKADLEETDVTAERLVYFAERYNASQEATVRRYVDLALEPTAAIFFRWKLKPSELSRRSSRGQLSIPGIVRREPIARLRVEYSCCNDLFDALEHHIPSDKSVAEESAIHLAALAGNCLNVERELLDLGAFRGWFRISVMPCFTPDSSKGPNGENGVIAIIQPTTKPRNK